MLTLDRQQVSCKKAARDALTWKPQSDFCRVLIDHKSFQVLPRSSCILCHKIRPLCPAHGDSWLIVRLCRLPRSHACTASGVWHASQGTAVDLVRRCASWMKPKGQPLPLRRIKLQEKNVGMTSKSSIGSRKRRTRGFYTTPQQVGDVDKPATPLNTRRVGCV